MTVIWCPVCTVPFRVKQSKTRTYCSRTCQRQASDNEVAHRLAEFHWIAGTDTWDNTARRLDFPSVKRMRKWLIKHGELEWVERINADGLPFRQGKWAA